MKVFDFEPLEYADQYRDSGYIYIPKGINPNFLSYTRQFLKDLLKEAEDKSLKEWHIAEKKQQFLFDFPHETDLEHDVKKVIASIAGLDPKYLSLCERHIKVYDERAARNPPPHKDRLASQVTVGIPLEVPTDSYLTLFPHTHRGINPFSTSALYRSSLDEADLPENILADIQPEELDVWPGDVVFFKGSAIYHERVNPANTSLLYLKFNGMSLDPLSEDPKTSLQRANSLKLLESTNDERLLNSNVAVSPRLERISRHYTRLYWREVIQLYIWGEKEITIDENELCLIKTINQEHSVRQLLIRMGLDDPDFGSQLIALRRLIKLGAIDLI